jgi:hypothetical protein
MNLLQILTDLMSAEGTLFYDYKMLPVHDVPFHVPFQILVLHSTFRLKRSTLGAEPTLQRGS